MMVEREGFEPSKAYAGRFTVCSLWPLGHLSPLQSRWPESNWQPTDYKSVALPIELHRPLSSLTCSFADDFSVCSSPQIWCETCFLPPPPGPVNHASVEPIGAAGVRSSQPLRRPRR